MSFEILKAEQFREFIETSAQKTFMQTPEIGQVRAKNGWQVYYLGMREHRKLIAATMVIAKKRYFGKSEFYALRGPILDYQNKELVTEFMEQLTEFVKINGGYCLRIDPYVIYRQRDGAGALVTGGIDNHNILETLKEIGFHKVKKENMEQVGWMYVLDIEGKTEEEILKNMKPNTRNIIRKTLKNGIEVKELTKEELREFYKIMQETGKRKGFAIREYSYFENIYDAFHPREEIKFLITKLNLQHHIELLTKEKEEKEIEQQKLSKAKYNDGKRKTLEEAIQGINKRIEQAKNIQIEKGDEITLSGSMFLLTKPEIVYLSSGNYEEFMMYNSQYLIQWEMIKYGIAHGYKRYNFYGIPDSFDKNDKDYGIYEFKTGFNGYVEELIGEYILPTSFWFYIIQLARKLKKHF